MIPPDVASRLQSSADVALRPVAPAQELTDKLGGLDVGQRVMAEIQAMLPNGTYRALINQRNITLALPFSAKSGDTLELLVTESDGKAALAVVSHQAKDGAAQTAREAVSATLSRTAQFISQLGSRPEEPGDGPKGLALNNNQPIATAPPKSAQDILPLLKQAIAQSGMFYESHQAEWVEGRLPQSQLLQEPQGRLSAAQPSQQPGASPMPARADADAAVPGMARDIMAPGMATRPAVDASAQNAAHIVAPQAQPIVQHQLDALATQNFVWQGQAWPGQTMRWEIEEGGKGREQADDEPANRWRTGLKLTLPTLGGISAHIQLEGSQVTLDIRVDEAETGARMRADGATLRQQLDDAGLTLSTFHITHGDTAREQENA